MQRRTRPAFSRRAASAVLASVTGGGTAFATAPTVPEIAGMDGQAIQVERFGADAASRDNTAALNRAFAHLRDEVNGGGRFRSAGGRHFLDFTGGVYRCQGSIDATGISGTRMWGLRFAPGCMIYSEAKGQVALDLYQSRFAYLDNVSVFGSFDAPPAVGLLLSHGTEKLNGTGEHLLHRCRVNGCFTKAALYNYSSEETLCLKSFFSNGYEGDDEGEVYAAVFTGRNLLNVQSAFRAVLNPSAQGAVRQTFNGNTALNCEFIRHTTDLTGREQGRGPALLIDDASTFRAWSYVRQWGANHPAVRLRSSGGLRNLILHLLIEGDRKENFPHYDVAINAGVDLRDIEIVDHNHWNAGPLLNISTPGILLNGLRIRKPLQRTQIFALNYQPTQVDKKIAARSVLIEDMSKPPKDPKDRSIKPSLVLNNFESFNGIIHMSHANFIQADQDSTSFSGLIYGPFGLSIYQSYETISIEGDEIETSAQRIRIQNTTTKIVALRSIKKNNTLPFDELIILFDCDLTIAEGGNIVSSNLPMKVRRESIVRLIWDINFKKWIIA